MPKLSIVIPVYNEAKTVHLILNKIRAVRLINDIARELIIVNDCSTDTTGQVIREYMATTPELDIQFVEHPVNQGKGAALHTGSPAPPATLSSSRTPIWNMTPPTIIACSGR